MKGSVSYKEDVIWGMIESEELSESEISSMMECIPDSESSEVLLLSD